MSGMGQKWKVGDETRTEEKKRNDLIRIQDLVKRDTETNMQKEKKKKGILNIKRS